MEYTNFEITQGDTFRLSGTYLDPSGQPISLVGRQIVMVVKNDFGGKITCATASIGSGITVTDAVNGKFLIEVSSNFFSVPKSAYQIKIANAGQDIEAFGDTLGLGYIVVNKGTI